MEQIRALERKVLGLINQLRRLRDEFDAYQVWRTLRTVVAGPQKIIPADRCLVLASLEIPAGVALKIESGGTLLLIG